MRYPEMSGCLENETKRKRFDDVPREEQIERFIAVQSFFLDKDELINKKIKGKDINEEDINRANYLNFFENINKYTDRFKAEGLDSKQVAKVFQEALAGNKIIKRSLEYFLEVKKMQTNQKNSMGFDLDALNKEIDENRYNFATSQEKGRQLDVEKLKKMFKWSLNTLINGGGEKIGRKPPEISEKEREALADDLEDILKHVNEYRK